MLDKAKSFEHYRAMQSKELSVMSETDEAIAYVRSMKGRWPRLAKETGKSYSLVQKIGQGKLVNPTANTIAAFLKHKAERA